MQYCSEVCNNNKLLEQRVSMLEHEQLKNRIERLEANNINSNVNFSVQAEEKVIKGNLAKLKSLLHQGLSEPEFYGDLVYKFKKIRGMTDFSDQFRKNKWVTNVLVII